MTPIRKTPTWQVSFAEAAVVLPSDAGGVHPLLGEGRLVDDTDDTGRRALRRGGQVVLEGGLDLGLDVVVPQGALLTTFCKPEASPWPARKSCG